TRGEGRSTPRLLGFLGTTVLNITNRRIDTHLRRGAIMKPEPTPGGADDILRELADTVTGAITNASRNETSAAIEAAIAQLEAKDREVIILRLVEGLTNQETAIELGEPPNNVSHRYRRALEKLREVLPPAFLDEFASD